MPGWTCFVGNRKISFLLVFQTPRSEVYLGMIQGPAHGGSPLPHTDVDEPVLHLRKNGSDNAIMPRFTTRRRRRRNKHQGGDTSGVSRILRSTTEVGRHVVLTSQFDEEAGHGFDKTSRALIYPSPPPPPRTPRDKKTCSTTESLRKSKKQNT